jgi:hypothetical protein
MRRAVNLGFRVAYSSIRNDILVPRYYDPETDLLLDALSETHELVSIQDLLDAGELELRQGKYVAKLHYGTGRIPYIRTSDIANWELRGSPKHGVAEAVWEQFVEQQDVVPGDVLLVHEGTYLIGTSAPVTRFDLPLLFQHHLAKFRTADGARITGPLLCALLSAPLVQRQIRARQFTADIIDSIVGRLEEVRLPIPRDLEIRKRLADACEAVYHERAEARTRLARLVAIVDEGMLAGDAERIQDVLTEPVDAGEVMALLGERTGFRAFRQPLHEIRNDVLIPAYYDPTIAARLTELEEAGCELVTIGELATQGAISLQTGDEVGKLAYGSGDIPFVRTSDLGTWELKVDPKQRVSNAVFESLVKSQSAQADDILVVRDGTYLVGTSAIVAESDVPMLFSGGIYRVRVEDRERLDPHLLLAALGSDVVRRQVRAKRFTRDVIDTLGRRFEEIVLALPPEGEVRDAVTSVTRKLVKRRQELRDVAAGLGGAVEAGYPPAISSNSSSPTGLTRA